MPYRSLPKTDLGRIESLQKAVSMEGYKENGQLVLSYQTIRDTQRLLSKFRNAQIQYQQYRNLYLKNRKTYNEEVRVARMYISHFVRVLYMTIQRGELKKEIVTEYGLNPDRLVIPPIKDEAGLEAWGRKIITGEEQRITKGGVPIYNPNIAKVKVYWSIFADHYLNAKGLKANAEKNRKELVKMRPIVDDLLHDLWNQVENAFADLPLRQSLEKCTQFGIKFYLSSNEKKQIEAEKLQNFIEF